MRSRPEVKEALERMWPVLSGAELVNDLFGFTRARAVGGAATCSPTTSRRCCTAPRAATSPTVAWTEDDVALIDEADALLGPVEAARPAAPAGAEPRRGRSTARHG